jgi:protein-tyrosine-phosphatase
MRPGGDDKWCKWLLRAHGKDEAKDRAMSKSAVRIIPLNVLFLCTGNSARSIMAEAILSREGRGNFRAFSAGSHPKGYIHPYVLDLLRKLNFDVTQFHSKNWDEYSGSRAPKLDFAFTLCDDAAAEVCPVWPGQPMTAHWGLPDPAAATGNEAERRLAFAETFRMLNNRISIFVNLPIKSLDQLSLQRRLDAIGKTKDAVDHPEKAAE